MLKNKRLRRVLILALIISLIVALIVRRPTTANSEYTLTNKSVSVDGATDGEITIELKTPRTGVYYGIFGVLSIHETTSEGVKADTEYFTLQSNEITELPASSADYKHSGEPWLEDPDFSLFSYEDNNMDGSTGLTTEAGDVIWRATYKVDKDTPTGTYYLTVDYGNMLVWENGEDITDDFSATVAAITVTNTSRVEITPEISGYESSYEYTGSQIKPDITVKDSADGTVLTKDSDYTVTYGENTNVGAGTITIKPASSSSYDFAEETAQFSITPHTITDSEVELAYTQIGANGTERKPGVTVTFNGNIISADNYDVTYANNVELSSGTNDATATVEGTGNFTGTVVKHFTIVDRQTLTISGIEDNQMIEYTGRPVVLTGNLSVSSNTEGITVNDLTTTWKDHNDNIISQPTDVNIDLTTGNINPYKVVYSYDGDNYVGSLTVNFMITPAPSDGRVLLAQLNNYGPIRVPAGSTLSEVEMMLLAKIRTVMPSATSLADLGVAWAVADPTTTTVTAGDGTYPVLYQQSKNHTPTPITDPVMVPIYGLSPIMITTSVEGEGGTISEGGVVLEDSENEITLTPDNGYKVSKVTVNGEEVEVNNNTVTVVAGTENLVVVATFEKLPITYNYLAGNGQTYTLKSNTTATFKIDAEYDLLDKVYVDDKLVDSSNYTSKSGSTVITFVKEFMEGLSVGNHTLKVTFTDDGVAATTFTVAAAQEAEDNTTNNVVGNNTVVDNTTVSNTVDNTVTTVTPTNTTTSNTPKTGDKVLIDIYIAIVSGLGIFMIIDHKLNSKPRKSTRRSK